MTDLLQSIGPPDSPRLFVGRLNGPPLLHEPPGSAELSGMTELSLGRSAQEIATFWRLYERIYIERFREHISAPEEKRLAEQFAEYFKLCDVARIYFRADVAVGALLLNRYLPHPTLKKNTRHIGFIGYCRELLGRAESRALKHRMVTTLRESCFGDGLVSATIADFNQPSLKFHARLGLKPE